MLVAMSAVLLQSCLKDQEDLFDNSASERLQMVLDNTKRILESSEDGWVLDYYPDRNLSYGGYVYTVKFDKAWVTAGLEIEPGKFEKSLYKLTNDNGPVLSFDSYNSLLHHFSTPSGSGAGPGGYQAYDGDFEFLIMDVTENTIRLRGNRTGNTMWLHRITEDAASYLASVEENNSNLFLESLRGVIGGKEVEVYMEPQRGSRYIEVAWGEGDDEVFGTCFVPTTDGIRLMEPLNVNGVTIQEFAYQVASFAYVGTASNGEVVTLQGDAPADYSTFEEFAGNFALKYPNGTRSIDVTLEASGEDTYVIKGLGKSFDVVAKYNLGRGCLEITSQQVGVDGDNYYWLCGVGLDSSTGRPTPSWSTDCGFFVKKDPQNPGTFLFLPNNFDELRAASLMVWRFAGSVDQAGYQAGGQAANPWRLANNSAQMANLHSLVKK